MSTAKERIRDARSALEQGQHRRAVQLCEQARANEKLSEAQLTEIFALLGRAHVALGEHDTALAFLKRTDRTAETLAAAKEAYAALELEGDPADVFERGDERKRKRRRARMAAVIGALVASPFVVGCCFCLATGQLAGPLAQFYYGPEMERMNGAHEAGEEAGRRGTVATCESVLMTGLAECSAQADDDLRACVTASITFQACLSTTSGWEAYCTDVPPAEPAEAARLAMERRCGTRAGELGLEGERRERFTQLCASMLSAMPYYCSDPEMRPTETPDDLGYDDYDDYELYE